MCDIENWLRIVQSFTLLPLGSVITRVPCISFERQVVVKALRTSPQFEDVADAVHTTASTSICGFISHTPLSVLTAPMYDSEQTRYFSRLIKTVCPPISRWFLPHLSVYLKGVDFILRVPKDPHRRKVVELHSWVSRKPLELGCRLSNPARYYRTRVFSRPVESFETTLVVRALRSFRQFDGVAPDAEHPSLAIVIYISLLNSRYI